MKYDDNEAYVPEDYDIDATGGYDEQDAEIEWNIEQAEIDEEWDYAASDDDGRYDDYFDTFE